MSTQEENPVVAEEKPEKKPPKKPKKPKAAKRKRAEQAAAAASEENGTDSLETPSKRVKTANTADSTSKSTAEPTTDSAIEYLHQWKNDRDSWKFKKLKDVWLIQHVYDLTKMDYATFKIMLKYLKKAPESRRKELKKEAKKTIAKIEAQNAALGEKPSGEAEPAADKEKSKDTVLHRAKLMKKKMKKSLKSE